MKRLRLLAEWNQVAAGRILKVLQPGQDLVDRKGKPRVGFVDARRAQALVDQGLAVEHGPKGDAEPAVDTGRAREFVAVRARPKRAEVEDELAEDDGGEDAGAAVEREPAAAAQHSKPRARHGAKGRG